MKIGRIEENTRLDKKEGSTLNEHVGNSGTIHSIVITYFVKDSLLLRNEQRNPSFVSLYQYPS